MPRNNRRKPKRNWAEKLFFHSILVGRSTSVYRNLRDSFFPERLSEEKLRQLRDHLCKEILNAPGVLGERAFALSFDHESFPQEVDRLLGYGLVTPAFVMHRAGSAIAAAPGSVSVSINDEDHLTFRFSETVPFAEQWKRVNTVVEALGKRITYAYNSTYGYLSANPEHVGLGVRLTATFCLFGLYLMKELDPVLHGLERLGFTISPMFVLSEQEENPLDAPGCCYRIHLIQMLGRVEDMIARAEHVYAEVARQEEQARFRLRAERPDVLEDFVLRSIGVSTFGVQIGESEGVDMVNAMIFGLDMDVLKAPDQGFLDDLHALLLRVTGPGIRQQVPRGDNEEDGNWLTACRRRRANIIRQVSTRLLPVSLDIVSKK